MRVGIGVISYKRASLATRVCQQILETIDADRYQITTVCSLDDLDKTGYEWVETHFGLIANANAGVAANKNRLLRYLKDCDLIFIVEDDIQFKKKGWIEIYLQAIQETHYQHFNYIVSVHREGIIQCDKYESITLGRSEHVNGVLMVFTKECVEKIGAFNLLFKRYGYEHADYTNRCIIAKLHPPYYCHVMEVSDYIDWQCTPSAIPEAVKETAIKKNAKIFRKKVIFPYLPFSYLSQRLLHSVSNVIRFFYHAKNGCWIIFNALRKRLNLTLMKGALDE